MSSRHCAYKVRRSGVCWRHCANRSDRWSVRAEHCANNMTLAAGRRRHCGNKVPDTARKQSQEHGATRVLATVQLLRGTVWQWGPPR